jgi:hypothetical protein
MASHVPGRVLVRRTILPQILLAIVSLFLVCAEARSSPLVLGSYTIELQQHINDAAPFGTLVVRVGGQDPFPCALGSPGSPGCFDLFTLDVTLADVGRTFTQPASSTPSAVAALTDGVNEWVGNQFRPSAQTWGGEAAVATPEQLLFFPEGGGPDFAGSIISDFRLTVDSLRLGPDPGPCCVPTPSGISFTVFVDGVPPTPVPEPRPIWLLAAGFCVVHYFRRTSTGKRTLERAARDGGGEVYCRRG